MTDEQQPHLTVKKTEGVCVVEFADRKILDELCISEIQNELSALVEGEKNVKILLCFKNVEHLSSAALGTLIALNSQVKEQEGQLKLSDITPPIYEVFKITRLNKLFSIHGTVEEALSDF